LVADGILEARDPRVVQAVAEVDLRKSF
jgi:hypothetical protein